MRTLWAVLSLVAVASQQGSAATWSTLDLTAAGLASTQITTIYRDPAGGMWVGSAHGDVAFFREGSWVVHPRVDGPVTAMAGSGLSSLWLATENTLYLLREERWRRWEGKVVTMQAKALTQIGGTACADAHRHNTGDASGYVEASPTVFDGVPFVRSEIRRMSVDGYGALWLAYRWEFPDWLVRFDGEGLSCWDDDEGLPDWVDGWSVLATGTGGILAAHGAGISQRVSAEGEWCLLDGSPVVTEVYEDGEGTWWAVSWMTVYRSTGSAWRAEAWSPEVGWVRGSCSSELGGVWVAHGFDEMAVARVSHGSVLVRDPPSAMPISENGGFPMAEESPGTVWIAAGGAIWVVSGSPTAAGPATWGRVKVRR